MKNALKPIMYLLHHFLVIGLMILPIENYLKMIMILASFYFVYGVFSKEERYLFVGVNLFFMFMNYMSIVNGIFSFSSPDLIRLPWYEFFMWGIYVLHLKRVCELFFKKEFSNYQVSIADFVCVGLVVVVFSVCKDKELVTLLPLLVNMFYLIYKKSKLLICSYVYFLIIGGILELAGTNSGQWSYPNPDIFGVPYWYVNVFGSFAIYFPLVYKGLDLGLKTTFMRDLHFKLGSKSSNYCEFKLNKSKPQKKKNTLTTEYTEYTEM